MTKMIEQVKEKSLGIVLSIIFGVLGYLLTIVWSEISVPIVQKVLPNISNKALLAIILILFALITILSLWIYTLYQKISGLQTVPQGNILSKYEFDKRLGIYKHNESGLYFCTSCLQSNVEAPLKESNHGWLCEVKSCGKFYSNPDYKSTDPAFSLHERKKDWSSF